MTWNESGAAMGKHMAFLGPQPGRNLRIAFAIPSGPVGHGSAARDNRNLIGNIIIIIILGDFRANPFKTN